MQLNNKKNILIIGFGSIGQRHFRNIKKLYNNINFYLLRKIYKTPNLTKNNNLSRINNPIRNSCHIIKSLKDINLNKIKITAAFICTPTSLHLKSLEWLLKNNINTFIEKPLSNRRSGLDKINKINLKSSSITMIGYQMRFNPIINFLKNKKNYEKLLGKLNFVEIKNGEDVRNFHKWEDYSKSYTSKKNLGGGVTLSQIHEFDYFQFLFPNYKIIKSKSLICRNSNFKINVDDTSAHLFYLKYKKQNLVCSINLNFYENPKTRTIKYICNEGSLKADLNKNCIIFYKNNKKKIKKFSFKRNDLFISELKYFFNCIKLKKKKHSLDLNYAIKNLKFVLDLYREK
jgi:predicted dehydrogenase